MGHTNSTTNYSLPQFITTDKPAWLTDINGAFSAIDSGLHTAQSDATTAKNTADSAQSDATAAGTAASTAGNKADGAIASIADAFDTTATYAVGDLVMYNSLLYTCSTAVTTPGSWTGTTNWSRTTVESQIPSTDNSISHYTGTPTAGSTAEAIGKATNYKQIFYNDYYQDRTNTNISLTDSIEDFRFLRVAVGVSSFDNWNIAWVIIPNCKSSLSGYYPIVANGTSNKWIRLSVDTAYPTTLSVMTSSESTIGIKQVIGIY